ncbi:rhodanese-like domain-containing protein [Corynebacterium sp. HS2168-gen11]|uniref:rhodanese-like domain-containing protein n=1 Tax=Corynebacterium sp. HS2168-gen11 TaxID=2974027 RepID=UPI00216B586F|nr:rhodanese-like domain-containing protein [Corynebacterium sp. HS2168-gen11]MCS4536118.1 rhodanese-like domain-containing protein [Corynebacterium sp. HS2168-gen11]
MREVLVQDVPTDAQLIDVREPDEYAAGHAATAINIPMGEISARIQELRADTDIYLICHSGGRSFQVGMFLAQQGLPVINVAGGTTAWHAAGLPMA